MRPVNEPHTYISSFSIPALRLFATRTVWAAKDLNGEAHNNLLIYEWREIYNVAIHGPLPIFGGLGVLLLEAELTRPGKRALATVTFELNFGNTFP